MVLAPLNNRVVFKKLFTDPEIVIAFVKDLTGLELDIQAEDITLEKKFYPPIGSVDIALDLLIEDPKHRLVIEIQKVRYDYHFDRFLHYHQAAIVELPKSNKAYKLDKTVHTIVWLTSRVKDPLYQHSLITTSFCSVAESGESLQIYPHKLYFINPYYLNDKTPAALIDWLQLVVESIVNPKEPKLNPQNKIINKATHLIADDGLTPQEMAMLLEENDYEENLRLNHKEGKAEGLKEGLQEGERKKQQEIARAMQREGVDLVLIAKVTGLTLEEIKSLLTEE